MLRFPDGTQVRVTGLSEVLADIYAEGRKANRETVEEIIARLEARKNFIPPSDRIRKEYAHVLRAEYLQYVNQRAGATGR